MLGMETDQHQQRTPLLSGLRIPDSVSTKPSRLLGTIFGNVRVHAAAATVQILYAGFQVLAKAAISSGTSMTVFPVYRNALAAFIIAPLAFFFERSKRPKLTFAKLCQFFLCSLIGVCINQTLFLAGLYYTSATFTATVQNSTPALTFAIAALLGIERVRLKKREGQAKSLGVLIGVAGATLIALYKGPSVLSVTGLLSQDSEQHIELETSQDSYVSLHLGVLCLLGNCVTWAIWFILQDPLLKDYPAPLSATAFTYFFGTVQLALIALCVERDIGVWITTLYSDLLAVLYGGCIASGVAMTIQAWCAYRGGPVLVAAYQPLQTILVAILSFVFLQESFYLGSLLGGLLIVFGLYLVVWGKSRERRIAVLAESLKDISTFQQTEFISAESGGLTEPLLNGESTYRITVGSRQMELLGGQQSRRRMYSQHLKKWGL